MWGKVFQWTTTEKKEIKSKTTTSISPGKAKLATQPTHQDKWTWFVH